MKSSLINSRNIFQYIATFSGSFSVIISGVNLGWTSPYLPKLQAPDSDIPTTSEEGLWCAVMALVGAPLGAILAAVITDKIGRKYTTLLMTPFMIFSLIIIAYARTIFVISLARFIIGAVEGGLYTVLPIYIAEISDPSIRGFLTSTIDVATISGTLFINAIGPYLTIFQSSWVCTLIPLIHFFTFVCVPESPYYFIKKGNLEGAKASLKILRRTDNVEKEFQELCAAVERQEANEKSNVKDLVMVKSNRKASCIFMMLCMANKFSGNNPLLFYTQTIFETAGTHIDPSLSVIIYCIVRLIGTIAALVIVDRFGKRRLIITSVLGCSVFLFLEGLYFFLKLKLEYMTNILNYLPITALLGYNVFFSIGLSYGPVMFLGELFPTNIKAIALCCADIFGVIMGTIASKYFQATMEAFGLHIPFWTFSLCCLIFLYLIVRYLPETKGKTLEQIQLYLINK